MKLHLPHTLRTALLCAFSLLTTLGTSNLYAGGMHSQVSLVTYTDFGQNMGRYRVEGVNELLSSIRQEEGGVVITYIEGHDDYTLDHYMPSFESQGDNGAYAAIGYNYIATVNHNGCQNPTFTGRYINGSDSLRYYGVEYRGNTVFCLQAATPDRSATHDYKVTRLNRLITDVTPSTPMPRFGDSDIAAQLRGRMEYRSGSGSMSLWDLDGYSTGLRSAYGYAIGAVRHIDTVGTNQYGFFTTNVTFDPSQNGISAEDPLPFSPDSGDSGSPVWVWDDATQSYLYMDSYQAISGRKGIATGAIDFTWDSLERFDVPVTVSGNTVHIKGVTATEEDEEISDGTLTAKLHKGHVIDGAGNSIDYVGVKADNNDYINTWLNLAEVKDNANWFAYDNKYYNVGTYNQVQRALNIEDLFSDSNLVFRASSAKGNVVEVDEDTDLGIGYLQFAIDPESGLDHAEYTLQSHGTTDDGHDGQRDYMVNSAGFVVEGGVDLHVKLTNTQWDSDANDYYYREWRKVGDGDLYLEGRGSNQILLNVGGSGTTYLRETDGYAAYNVYVGSGATVVTESLDQIARDFTFGYYGGTLDIRGNNSMDWYRTNPNVADTGFSINSFSEDSYITNSQAGTTLTLTYREGGETEYLGSFVDTEDGGAVRIRFDAGDGSTTTLRSIHTDLTHQKGEAASGSAVFVDSGKVVLSGSNTVHALGSESGRNTNRYSSTEDWHYADMAGDVHVDNGAEFELGSHARLTGDVYVYTGGTLTIREGVLSTYEYIEGGQRLEDTTSAFYRQFYGLHGNIETDAGTELRFEYSAGTTAEQVYSGNISGGADIYMDLGDGRATLRLSGNNTFLGGVSLSGGGLISDNGLDALGFFGGSNTSWHMAADAFIAASGASGEELLGILSRDSQGMLALTQDQATDLNPQGRGYNALFIGALTGNDVRYGTREAALATATVDGHRKWLLGGGGGNLIVDGLLQDADAELVLGNGYTGGIVTLTNTGNNIGSITFTGRVTLAYTDAAALGGDVHLDYTRRMLLAAAADTSHVTADSCGVVLVDNLEGGAPDMRGHAELYIGASNDAQLNDAPQIDTGASYRFGGIEGTLTVNTVLADAGAQSSGLVVDGQTYSGGALVFAQSATLTGDVVVRGYDAGKVPADAPQGDITLGFTCDNALADAASVTLQDGSYVNLNGTSQTFRNLNTVAGSVIASAIGSGALNVEVDSNALIAGELHLEHLVKQGEGTLVLTGANTVHVYDVQDGMLYATTNNSLYSSTVNVYNGGVVSLATGTTNTLVNLHEGGELYLAETTNVSLQRGLKFLGNSTITGPGKYSVTTSEFGVQGLTVTLKDTTVDISENGTFHQKGTFRGEGNSTIIINGGDNKDGGHDYLRVFDRLDVASGSTLTIRQSKQDTAPTFRIHDVDGSGKLVLDACNYKADAAHYIFDLDTDFAGTVTFQAHEAHSGHKYMSHMVIQSDNALACAQVEIGGVTSDNGIATLGIDTNNAAMQGLRTLDGSNNRAVLMAGYTESGAVERPVSTRRATLTILGSESKDFKGIVSGGAEGTDNGLSVVMNGTGVQTFSGVSVFNDVSALQGTLKITNTSADSSIKGDLTVARGANLTIGKGYSLNEGKTLHVLGNAADAASLSTALTLAGGTIEFSCAQLGAETPALNVSSIVAGSVSIGFTDTESLQERGYLLSNGNWVGSSVDGLDLQYLNAEFNGTADGLYVTFSAKDGCHVWAGTADSNSWSGTNFGPNTVAFSNTETAVFNDAAQVKDVHIGSDNTAAQLIFDSSQQYTVGNDGSHVVTAARLHHTGSGTTIVNGGVQVDEIQLDAGELLVRDAALLDAATVSGNGTLGIDLGEGTAINLPALGEDGIGALRLVSGTLNVTETLNVAREAFVEERASLTSNTAAFLKSGATLHLAGNLTLNLSGSPTLNTSITGIDDRMGTLALTGGTLTVNQATALQVGTLDIRQGTMVVHRGDASVREIGTLKLGNTTTFSQYSDTQPGTAMEIGSLVMEGNTATLKEENNSGALAIRSLSHSGSGSATLNLTNSATSTIIATFYLGGADESADDFSGTINLSSTNSGGNRSAAIILNDANVAARAAVNLTSAASGGALLGLGVNAERVEIAGLSSGNGLGNRARVFSGGLAVNTQTSDDALAGDDTVRELVITTASGANCMFNGTIGKNLDLTVGGEGSQSLNGDNSAFNGTLTLKGGTLALGNSGIGSESSSGGFNATLEGGTLKLADNTVNLGTGSLVLSGSTTISLDAASTDPALSGYTDGADHENGYFTLTVLRAAAVENHDATLTGAGVLQDMEFTVTGTAITAQAGASNRSYFVNTAVQYGADATNTAYAQAHTLVLNTPDATLRMTSGLSGVATGGIQSHGGTVSLAEGVTLQAASLHADAATKLSGEGRYAISCASNPTLGANVSLGADWNGILSFSGGDSIINIQLNTLAAHAISSGTAYSTVEFDGASGYLQGGGSNTFASNIILAADKGNVSALNISNGNSNAVYTFSGNVSGSGSIERSATSPGTLSFTFSGNDISEWSGVFENSSGRTTNISYVDNAPAAGAENAVIASSVLKSGAGSMTLTYTNASHGLEVLGGIASTNSTGTLDIVLSASTRATFSGGVAGAHNLTVNNNAEAAFTKAAGFSGTVAVKSGASVQLLATGETPVQHSVGTIAFDGGDAFNRNLLVAEGVKLTAANINNAWGVGTLCVEGEMDVTSLLKFASGGNGSTLNNIITGNGTINAAALEFSNIGTYNVTDLHELNVSGTTTFNTSNTVNVSASTLNLNGTVTTNRGYLNLKDGAAVNINGTSGTNTLQNLNTSASSTLAFAQGTTATISGTGSLAATIVNAGNLTLSGTYSLDGFDISQSGNFTEGQQSGNGFLTGDLSIRLVSGGTVQEGDALVLTYFGKEGSLNAETGCVAFAGAGQPQYDTFYVNKADTMESLDNAIQRSSGTMESIRMADGTTLAMDRDGATLDHLVLAERASATLNVTQSGTIDSVEGLGAGQTLTVSGAAGKVLTLNAGNSFAGLLDVQAGTLQLGANLTLAGGLANGGTINLNNKALTMNGQAGGTSYTMGTLSNGGSSDMTLNNHAEAVFDKDASVRRVVGNAGSALVVGDNATLTLTSTDNKKYFTQVGDLDVRGTLRLKGGNGAIRIAGYEDGQVFNLGHLDIDGASGTTYVLTSGGVNYTTDIVVKSLSGGGANNTLQASDCYTGGSVGMVIDFIIGEAQDHTDLYTGKIQYGIGTSSAKAGSGMNLVIKDELVASKAVLDAIFGNTDNAQSATITVDTARAKVKGLTGSGNDARTMQVSGTDATGNRVLEIVGDGNYTYGGKLGANLDVVHSGSGTQSFGGVDGFNGSIDVEGGVLNILNAASVNVHDVTINNSTLGVYKGTTATAETASEGTLTIKDGHTLTASGENAKLNANLVMESGSTLDVSAYGGMGGLHMGSSITLNPGMFLSDKDMEGVSGLGFMDAYDLYYDVESFSIGAQQYSEITFDSETWVKANEVFNNDLFKTEGKDYYVFYSGVNPGGNGGNVGTIYIVQVPEPTTGTLSLLALCALAARRRRKA